MLFLGLFSIGPLLFLSTHVYELQKATTKLTTKAGSDQFNLLLEDVASGKVESHRILLESLQYTLAKAIFIVNTMTAVQTLQRPLRVNETRDVLAARCKLVVKGNLPKNVDMYLVKIGGGASPALVQANAAKSKADPADEEQAPAKRVRKA